LIVLEVAQLRQVNRENEQLLLRQQIREVARTTENATTKLRAEGLTALTEALRDLDATLTKVNSGQVT
jgi:hypothetical protein